MGLKKIGKLQIEEEALDEKTPFWWTQKICLVLMTLFLISVLFGITGSGLLSHKTVFSSDQHFKLVFDRFGRNTVPNTINILVNQSSNIVINIGINKSYLQNQEIVEIAPRPIKVVDAGDRFKFYFLKTPNTTTDILFKVKPENMGVFKGNFYLDDNVMLPINQYIFP